jgi:hypothetical protein
MSDYISKEDFFLIARDLEIYHAVFSKIWNVGKPRLVTTIPTAAVSFDKNGNFIDFQFNVDFWNKLTSYERLFVICHECLHIILNHGVRLKTLNPEIGNVSADVVINELLATSFGFDRSKLITWVDKNGCWLNTVFKEVKVPVESDKSTEYYYNILKSELEKNILEQLASGNLKIIDDHSGLEGISSEGLEDILGDILNSMNDLEKSSLEKSLSQNENEVQESCKTAGSLAGTLKISVSVAKVKKKKKWETVIKKWANRFIKDTDKDHEQWARINRRFSGMLAEGMFLPSEMEVEERDEIKKKIKVIFFQDTSGSCVHLAERFFSAAKSLPTKRFDVELYCFDTQVYKTSLQSGELYGFGGTRFDILEAKVMEICKGDLSKYPKAVFVISDGYGGNIIPKKPKNWYWFLSEWYLEYIPTECNKFRLSEFE